MRRVLNWLGDRLADLLGLPKIEDRPDDETGFFS